MTRRDLLADLDRLRDAVKHCGSPKRQQREAARAEIEYLRCHMQPGAKRLKLLAKQRVLALIEEAEGIAEIFEAIPYHWIFANTAAFDNLCDAQEAIMLEIKTLLPALVTTEAA